MDIYPDAAILQKPMDRTWTVIGIVSSSDESRYLSGREQFRNNTFCTMNHLLRDEEWNLKTPDPGSYIPDFDKLYWPAANGAPFHLVLSHWGRRAARINEDNNTWAISDLPEFRAGSGGKLSDGDLYERNFFL